MAGTGFPAIGVRIIGAGRAAIVEFSGLWTETTMWEIYALSAIDELKTRASLKRLSEFELDILYARAKTRLVGKDGAAARSPTIECERLWNAPAAQLSVA
jgi:nicotinic acid phosphoribosyltransferase